MFLNIAIITFIRNIGKRYSLQAFQFHKIHPFEPDDRFPGEIELITDMIFSSCMHDEQLDCLVELRKGWMECSRLILESDTLLNESIISRAFESISILLLRAPMF